MYKFKWIAKKIIFEPDGTQRPKSAAFKRRAHLYRKHYTRQIRSPDEMPARIDRISLKMFTLWLKLKHERTTDGFFSAVNY